MRSLKTTGGLTRGCGMTEAQRALRLLSMPSCVSVNMTMQEITGVIYSTSEQHKDVTVERYKRDCKDITLLAKYVDSRNPFSGTESRL